MKTKIIANNILKETNGYRLGGEHIIYFLKLVNCRRVKYALGQCTWWLSIEKMFEILKFLHVVVKEGKGQMRTS